MFMPTPLRIESGVRAEVAGSDGVQSNGNGSLMRILPVALRFAGSPTKVLLERVRRGSAITHRHPRSQMACGLYALVVRGLLAGLHPSEAFAKGMEAFRGFYEPDPWWAAELEHFQLLLAGGWAGLPESQIESGGCVIHTLTASLWCLLTTGGYSECALKAVNLGGDTDTTGTIAGGLAGVLYGVEAIPAPWRQALAGADELDSLFNQFLCVC
jgi:ADP-ribosyl-[dinitrogen reductase] hydrolase